MPGRHVPQDGVVDLEHADDLVERVRRAFEHDEVIDALVFLADLVLEPSPSPGVVAPPRAAAALDEAAHARDQLLLPSLGQVRIEQQQNLVRRRHRPDRLLPTV